MADKIISRRTELEKYQHQIAVVTDESLESTRRMLNMVIESEDAGKRTIETLDVQGQQIKNIEQGMDHINADMTKAERSLNRLKRCCNVCSIPWKKVPTQDESHLELKSQTTESSKIIVNQPQRDNGISVNATSGYITRITNDAREDEMDANLCQVNSILGNLHNMAVDMNTELRRQNDQIGRITTKGTDNSIRLDHVNTTANNLLK